MNFKIPMVLVRAWDTFSTWGNTQVSFRYDIRRLDFVMAALCILCISWYGFWYGWMGVLQGGGMFVAVSALALFMRRK